MCLDNINKINVIADVEITLLYKQCYIVLDVAYTRNHNFCLKGENRWRRVKLCKI